MFGVPHTSILYGGGEQIKMVLGMLLDKYLGVSETVAMVFAGLALVLLGGAHLLFPASSTLGMILGAGNGLTSLAGVATRVIGFFVLGAGVDILGESY